MKSLKSQKRTLPMAATIERALDVNTRYGISLQPGKLALVTEDVEHLTAQATATPFSAPDMLALVQQVVLATRHVAVHTMLDLQDPLSNEYVGQSASEGFLLVIVNSVTGHARQLTVRMEGPPGVSKSELAALAGYLEQPSHPEAFLQTVSSEGFDGCRGMLRNLNLSIAPSNVHFRPVLSQLHLEAMQVSLPELIGQRLEAPSLSKLIRGTLIGAGSPKELAEMLGSFCKPRH